MGKEARKTIRISCSIPALLRFPSGSIQDGWGVIYDISLGGIKLETRSPISKGDIVYVSFNVSDNLIFENMRGRAVRVLQEGVYFVVGVEFDLAIDKNHLKEGIRTLTEGKS